MADVTVRRRRGEAVAAAFVWGLLVSLGYAAAYHLAMVLGVIGFGPRGELPPGDGIVFGVSVTMVVGGIVLAVSAGLENSELEPFFVTDLRRTHVLWAISLMAFAVVIARYFSPDPYYLSTHGSIADGGTVDPQTIRGLFGLTAIASIVTWLRPRTGLFLTALVLLLSAGVVSTAGYGH